MTTPSHSESPTHLDLAHSWFKFVEKGGHRRARHYPLRQPHAPPAPGVDGASSGDGASVQQNETPQCFHPPEEVIQTADSNTIVIHRTGNGVTKKGYAYHNEYIFIFKFEGGKIVSIKEFIDVKAFEGVVAAASMSMEMKTSRRAIPRRRDASRANEFRTAWRGTLPSRQTQNARPLAESPLQCTSCEPEPSPKLGIHVLRRAPRRVHGPAA
ncbi:hypothetical protein C8J57DRAFT_1476472 [Mycena rebaudengoi]|nr:hypothetical protein C8J57DRAFT_1476472 [Mycena rebaudengoi]